MSYVLISLFVVAVVLVVVFWYMTRDYRSIPEDRVINLASEEDRILNRWYEHHLQPSLDLNLNGQEIAAQLLEHLYGIQVDSEQLVIGTDIDREYYRLTGYKLEFSTELSTGDQVFDLRRYLGKSGQVAIIQNHQDRWDLYQTVPVDLNQYKAILDQGLDVIARDYLREVLTYRWDKINKLADPDVMNQQGAYLYLRNCQIPNVETQAHNNIHRINLLCTDLEFETLIIRWRTTMAHTTTPI